MGWVLVVFFGVGAVLYRQINPERWITQIWLGVAALLAVLYVVMRMRAKSTKNLLSTGVRGRADILELTQTGTFINKHPVVTLRLWIEAPGVLPFEAPLTMAVPPILLGALQPGRPLTVVVDPADPQKFVVDWSGISASPQIAFSTPDGRTTNLAGDPTATTALMQIFQKYGLESGKVMDFRGNPQVRGEILTALQRAGYLGAAEASALQTTATPATAGPGVGLPNPARQDPALAAALQHPSAPIPYDEDPDPVARLAKLAALRDAGTITPAEFEQHRLRILSDI